MRAAGVMRFLPEVSEHTTAVGPKRTNGVAGVTSLD